MKHHSLWLASLVFVTGEASGSTFDLVPYAPELGVDVMSRRVAQDLVDRKLFGNPYATVLVGRVDVYDVFPYVESRYFQVVSDPEWNRLLVGEADKSLDAVAEVGAFGALDEPHGLSVDADGRVYVADTGNDRVLVLQANTEFDSIRLDPVFAIDGLSRPFDVAYSDGGTPFDRDDDRLYVADTGQNRVVAYALHDDRAEAVADVGRLGSGDQCFGGPTALTVGRVDGVHTGDVYVADAHSGRIVHLRDAGTSLTWVGECRHGADVVTALDTDRWGNLYLAQPNAGSVAKYTGDLSRVASIDEQVRRPRSFHVPFLSVTDHRSGERRWEGQSSGMLVEEWSDEHGLRMWNLGVEVADLVVGDDAGLDARFRLTDRADIVVDLRDAASGRVMASRRVNGVDAGDRVVSLRAEDFSGPIAVDTATLRVRALSGYDDVGEAEAEAEIRLAGHGLQLVPERPMLLGNFPNPFNPMTRVGFLVPDGVDTDAVLRVFDVQGRQLRSLALSALTPGYHEVAWDGRDDAGREVASGVYLYRMAIADEVLSDRMVLVR